MDFREHWKIYRGELKSRGFTHATIETLATYSPWEDDLAFQAQLSKVRYHTLIDTYRLYELHQLAKQTQNIEGDVLEVGVWRGGSAALLAMTLSDKWIYMADTFEGVVGSSLEDFSYKDGEHADTSESVVKDLLSSLNVVNFEILKGRFPDENAKLIKGKLSFVHIDVDVFESAKLSWEFVYNRLSIGGVVVFDDYGFSSTDGVAKFVNQIINDDKFIFIYNLNGHAVLIRRS